jgi:hypothetical protein
MMSLPASFEISTVYREPSLLLRLSPIVALKHLINYHMPERFAFQRASRRMACSSSRDSNRAEHGANAQSNRAHLTVHIVSAPWGRTALF